MVEGECQVPMSSNEQGVIEVTLVEIVLPETSSKVKPLCIESMQF